MYDDAVDALHQHLIQTSTGSGHYVYTAELVPESFPSGEMQAFILSVVALENL